MIDCEALVNEVKLVPDIMDRGCISRKTLVGWGGPVETGSIRSEWLK